MSDDEALSAIVRIADVLILRDVALLDVFELVPSMHMKLLADGTFGDRESTLLFFSNLAQVLGLGGFSAIVSDDMVVAITEAFVEADALQDPRLINLAAMIVAIGLDRGMTEWNSLMVYMEECIMRADDDSPMSRVLELIMDTISNEQLMNGPD
jgi:hypothetical protein